MILLRPVLLCLLLASVPASAQAPHRLRGAAKRHLDRGIKLYNLQQYAQAIDEFKEGYELDPSPEFLFAMAQAERLEGQCEKAIQGYEAFLRSSPSERQVAVTQQRIAECRSSLAALQPKESRPTNPAETKPPAVAQSPASSPALAPPPPPVATSPSRVEAKASGSNRLPVTIGIGAAAALAAGASIRIWAQADFDKLSATCSPVCPPSSWSGVRTREYVGDGLVGLGLAGAVAEGVVLVLRHPGSAAARAVVVPQPSGVALAGTF